MARSTTVRKTVSKRKAPVAPAAASHVQPPSTQRTSVQTAGIEPKWYVRFEPGSIVAGHLDAGADEAVYGRIGIIHYEHKPAIRLLEVVRAGRASDMDGGSSGRKPG